MKPREYSPAVIDAALRYLICRLPEIDRYLPANKGTTSHAASNQFYVVWALQVSWSIEDLRTDAFADTISLLPVMGVRPKFEMDFDPAEHAEYINVRDLGLRRSHPEVTWNNGEPQVSLTYYQLIPKEWMSPADLALVEKHK